MTEALKLLERIFASLSIGVLVIHREQPDDSDSFTVLYCNDAGGRAVGLAAEGLIGKRMIDAFPNLREAGFIDKYVTTLASGEVHDGGEMVYGDARVDESVFQVRFAPLDQHTLVVTYTNITEQKRALRPPIRNLREMATARRYRLHRRNPQNQHREV